MEPERRGIKQEDGKGNGAAKPQSPAVAGVFEIRCSICRLVKSHPDIARVIHERHFRDRQSYDAIMIEVNGLIAEQGLDAKPLTRSVFTSHFTKHVPADAAFVHAVQSSHEFRGDAGRPAQSADIMAQVLEYKRENIAQLQENLQCWKRVATAVYNRMDVGSLKEGDPLSDVAMRSIEAFRGATAAITTITSALDRYVNGKDFTLGILREGIEHFGGKMVYQLGAELAAIKDAGAQGMSADDVIDQVYKRLMDAMTSVASDARNESNTYVVEKFKLHRV